ncbi:hypothetical protein DER44DRAFT_342846 [Fusarium oxysporum]|nr:hypothetical protein DER44DRAFT_342846 [Fusarium oxysporum]
MFLLSLSLPRWRGLLMYLGGMEIFALQLPCYKFHVFVNRYGYLARRNLVNSYTANDDPWKTSNMPDPLSIAGSAF